MPILGHPTDASRISRHHRIEGFKGGPELGPRETPVSRTADIDFPSPVPYRPSAAPLWRGGWLKVTSSPAVTPERCVCVHVCARPVRASGMPKKYFSVFQCIFNIIFFQELHDLD